MKRIIILNTVFVMLWLIIRAITPSYHIHTMTNMVDLVSGTIIVVNIIILFYFKKSENKNTLQWVSFANTLGIILMMLPVDFDHESNSSSIRIGSLIWYYFRITIFSSDCNILDYFMALSLPIFIVIVLVEVKIFKRLLLLKG